MNNMQTPEALKKMYHDPFLGREGNIELKEKTVLENIRDSFVLEYPKNHPTQDPDMQTAERTLEYLAKMNIPPTGWFTHPSANGETKPKSFYGNFPDYKSPETIQIGNNPNTKIRALFSDKSVSIEQGSLFTPLRWSGMYFIHARTSTVNQALNFMGHGETQINDFFNDPSVIKQLFPTYIPYYERPDTQKDIGECNLMVSDIRTKLPNGERGLLRAGFLIELAYKYLAAKEQFGKKNIDGIVSILRGDGDMDDYYRTFKESQKMLSEEFPDYTTDQINAVAAEKTLPHYSMLGFTERRVVEFPERNIVVVSSLQPKNNEKV